MFFRLSFYVNKLVERVREVEVCFFKVGVF